MKNEGSDASASSSWRSSNFFFCTVDGLLCQYNLPEIADISGFSNHGGKISVDGW